MRGEPYPRPLSIFLATDHIVLREEFIERFTKFGTVYFNSGNIAHLGESELNDEGRLPTLAEFYLLAKSHVIVELDNYLSSFSMSSSMFGNGTLVGLPRQSIVLRQCARRNPASVGKWRSTDPLKVRNEMFSF